MPLGHDLGADDDIRAARRDQPDLVFQRPGRSEQVRRQDRHPRLGEPGHHFFRHALHPGADRGHAALCLAAGAGQRNRFRRAALVADQPLQKAVLHHARIAVIAAHLVPAGAAERDRRITTPVQEQQRLFALVHPRRHRSRQSVRYPAVRGQLFAAHVDGPHLGQFGGAEARAKVKARIFARFGIGPAFQAGRGRGQHHRRAADRRAQHRHVAGIVENTLFLLVAAVVFLIDHDQPQLAERQEQRRARAHHKLRLPRGQHPPDPAAFGDGHARMPFGGPRAKAGLDPRQEIRRQRNFRQQHQRLPPRPQAFGDRLQIDFRLARPGDALQQRGGIAALRHGGDQRIGSVHLFPGQCHARKLGVKPGIGQIARRVLFQHGPRLDQPLDHRCRHPRLCGQLAQRHRRPAEFVQRGNDPAPRLGHPVRHVGAGAQHPPHRGRITQPWCARGKPQHRRQRRQRVIGGTGQKLAQFLAHRGGIHYPQDRAQLGLIEPARARPPDHAQHPARPQRHLDEIACAATAFGRPVVQKTRHPAQRFGRHHANARTFGKDFIRHGTRQPFASLCLALIRGRTPRNPDQDQGPKPDEILCGYR